MNNPLITNVWINAIPYINATKINNCKIDSALLNILDAETDIIAKTAYGVNLITNDKTLYTILFVEFTKFLKDTTLSSPLEFETLI